MKTGAQLEYILRPASEADYQYCYRLTKRNMYDLFCRHWGGWNPSKFRQSFHPENISMIIINGRRVGYLSIKNDDIGIYIDNVQLSPALHGRGIGTDVLGELLNRHKQDTISLTTFTDNPVKRLYERLGFRVTKVEGMTLRMSRIPR